ncbi:MAG: hypothetical protein IJ417_03335, partial [Bacteroidaceae bacterium]|nr:hypothetical protein [Bacteroidaceae bacterium]
MKQANFVPLMEIKGLLILLCGLLFTQHLSAQTGYNMAGPYEVIARDGQYRHSKGGSERDMKKALEFAQKGDSEKALQIIHAYAKTLQRLEGHDAP